MKEEKKKAGSISKKLLVAVIPLIIISIVAVMSVGISSMYQQLNQALQRSIQEESRANANKIQAWTGEIIGLLKGVKSGLEDMEFASEEEELKYMETTVELIDS